MAQRCMEAQKLINEKTLQRYIFETLTYGGKEKYRSFFPEKFKEYSQKSVKVIIPEYPIFYSKTKKHFADFRIVFKDGTYLNIEVEWKTSKFIHGQEVYDTVYKDEKGFLIVLHDDCKEGSFIQKENISVISAEEFSFWFLKKSKHIVNGTISNYVPNYNSRSHKNWLIFLASTGRNGGDSKNDYLIKGRKKGVWAFRYSNTSNVMQNILDITAGDTVVFVYDFNYYNGTRGRQFYIDSSWNFSGLDIVKVKNGYYCDLNDDTFETENWRKSSDKDKIMVKDYMHYFQFEYFPNNRSERYFSSKYCPIEICNNSSNTNEWKMLIDKLRWSSSKSGAPVEITDEEMRELYTILNDAKDWYETQPIKIGRFAESSRGGIC